MINTPETLFQFGWFYCHGLTLQVIAVDRLRGVEGLVGIENTFCFFARVQIRDEMWLKLNWLLRPSGSGVVRRKGEV